jgi:hypothetical protein
VDRQVVQLTKKNSYPTKINVNIDSGTIIPLSPKQKAKNLEDDSQHLTSLDQTSAH